MGLALEHALAGVDLVDLLRAGCLTLAASALALNSFQSLKRRFISYGARALPSRRDAADPTSPSLLDCVAGWDVPHSYFTQFYYFSVFVSLFWWYQLLARGWAFRLVAGMVDLDSGRRQSAMSFNQIFLCWGLFSIQAVRRLYECIAFEKPSKSRMFVGHWLYGFAYYIVMGIAIWIEGAATLLSTDEPLGDAQITAPSLTTMVCMLVFIFASGIQHDCHEYLASLVKYTLPVHPAFARVISPHYTAECLIYLAISVLAAPPGSVVNKTVFSGLILTAVTLGASAVATKQWYAEKFGKEKVENRWIMLPPVW